VRFWRTCRPAAAAWHWAALKVGRRIGSALPTPHSARLTSRWASFEERLAFLGAGVKKLRVVLATWGRICSRIGLGEQFACNQFGDAVQAGASNTRSSHRRRPSGLVTVIGTGSGGASVGRGSLWADTGHLVASRHSRHVLGPRTGATVGLATGRLGSLIQFAARPAKVGFECFWTLPRPGRRG